MDKKKTYRQPHSEVVGLTLGDSILDEQFGNASYIKVAGDGSDDGDDDTVDEMYGKWNDNFSLWDD
ncbi:MAG: hypothetical protein IJ196_08835 [Prevotella sp.]|nr:hypothetical protein [Prevotella sp.]